MSIVPPPPAGAPPPIAAPVPPPPPTPPDLTQSATGAIPPPIDLSQAANTGNTGDEQNASMPEPTSSQQPPLAPPEVPQGNLFPTLARVHGAGVIPAHELELRGPSVIKAQEATNNVADQVIGGIRERSSATAANDYDIALDQYRQAQTRQAAFDQSTAERQQELADRQQDFDEASQQISRTAINPNQFWQSRSTGQRIFAMIGMGLGGFIQGATGRANPAMDIINQAIDRDINAQIQNYGIQRDRVNGRQTAFSLAMQKYNNVDAARALAHASAIDAVQAQVAQSAALWKGTDAQNRADLAIGALQDQKLNQLMMGTRFILPQATGPTFVDPDTGLTYTGAEVKQMQKEGRGFNHENQGIDLHTRGGVYQERAKQEGEMDKARYEASLNGGMDKAARSEIAKEHAKAEMEANGIINTVLTYDPKKVAAGGSIGAMTPRRLQTESQRVQEEERDRYASDVRAGVGAAWRLKTGGVEPKNPKILEDQAQAFLPQPNDSDVDIARRRANFIAHVQNAAQSKGVAPPKLSKAASQSLQTYGGK